MNRQHLQGRKDNLELEARIANFELAARMQIAATDALDLTKETAATRAAYGLEQPETATYGRQCLMARRLVERGVRFVQVMMAGQPWDTHTDNSNQLKRLCRSTNSPVSALLTDLKQRGLLDETLVIWTGEFGRTPFAEGKDGRDHHKRGFSLWVAGGGVRGGVAHGATDPFGYAAVQDVVTVADFHATLLTCSASTSSASPSATTPATSASPTSTRRRSSARSLRERARARAQGWLSMTF